MVPSAMAATAYTTPRIRGCQTSRLGLAVRGSGSRFAVRGSRFAFLFQRQSLSRGIHVQKRKQEDGEKGRDSGCRWLVPRFSAVVLAYGCEGDRHLFNLPARRAAHV